METVLRVSELGQCARRVAYAHDPKAVPEVSEEMERVMALGHLLEALRKRELKKEGRRVFSPQAEIRFGPATGHIDGYVKKDGETMLWEAKSTTGFSLAKWRAEGLPRRIGWQIHGYMVGLGDRLGETIRKTLLETIDRTNGEIFSWTYDRDESITRDALQRAAFLSNCLQNGTIPEREFDDNSSDCRYCPFRSTCRPGSIPSNATQELLDASEWPGWVDALEIYETGHALKEEGEGLVSRARDIIQDSLKAHHARKAIANGRTVVWSQVETNRFDSKGLQKERPEIYSAFLKPSTYTRLEIRR